MYNVALFILLFLSLAHRHLWKVQNTNEIQFFTQTFPFSENNCCCWLIHGRYRIQMKYNFFRQTFPFSESNCCCWLKLHFGQFIQWIRPNTLLQIYLKHPRQNMFLNILRKNCFNTTSSVEQLVVNPRF